MQKVAALLTAFMITAWMFSGIGSYAQKPSEISATDIFSLKDWNSREVTVLGVKLGMLRSEAVRAAQASGFAIPNCKSPRTGRGTDEDFCGIYQNGLTTFVDLYFDMEDRVKEILIQLYVIDAGGPLWMAKHMKGMSGQLATQYSDALRVKLLGMEEEHCIQNPSSPPPKVQAYFHTFEYLRRGFGFSILRVTDPDSAEPKLVDVEIRLRLYMPKE
jgi:hypothetical protein